MSNFTINKKYITKPSAMLIDVITEKLNDAGYFVGIGEAKEYEIKRITLKEIIYMGDDRNQGQPESIALEDLKQAIDLMKNLPVFNTDTELLKEKIPTSLNRKRTPLFGLLAATEIIIKVEP